MHLASLTPALASLASGWEVVVILGTIFLLFGRKRFPDLLHGLCKGFGEFKKATRDVSDGIAFDAGRSLGGIYGKTAAEALTPNNHVAELYDPSTFKKKESIHRKTKKLLTRLIAMLRRLKKWFKAGQ
jgi:TatA/E family protein of Tat protein translocase